MTVDLVNVQKQSSAFFDKVILDKYSNPHISMYFVCAVAHRYVGGCENPAAVTVVAGSGLKPEEGAQVIDYNIRSKWVAKGEGESLWLELASPTVIDSVAIAFRKVGGR